MKKYIGGRIIEGLLYYHSCMFCLIYISIRKFTACTYYSAAVESTGQAKAETQSRTEAAKIKGEAAVEQAKLKAEASKIEAVSSSITATREYRSVQIFVRILVFE